MGEGEHVSITEQIDELVLLANKADLDPLKSTHIISPGFTHMANLTEHIQEGGGKGGRGRCLAMIPKEWADYIAALDNRTPALLRVLRCALKQINAQADLDHDEIDQLTAFDRLVVASAATDAAIREAEKGQV